MKKFLGVCISYDRSDPSINTAHLYYEDSEIGLKLSLKLTYEQGMEELHKLEERLGCSAKLNPNRYNSDIVYKELYGYIDRE